MVSSRILLRLLAKKISIRGFLFVLVRAGCLLASTMVVVACAQGNATQQRQDEATAGSAARARSSVHGRVIYEDTRRPLRRITVTIYDPANRGRGINMMAWTNGRGEFEIKNVPAGKYYVFVEAPGIIRSGPFESEETQKDLTTVTVDGTSKSEVTIRVRRGGAVSGKVTYADGDPVINAPIKILRKKEGKWLPFNVGGRFGDSQHTDERGLYRIAGLSPGEYLIGASEEKMGVELTAQDDPDGGTLLNRALLLTTYYDGATSSSGATPLQIAAGEEKTDINIALADLPLRSISGTVTFKADGRPAPRARLSLKRKDDDLISPYFEEPVVNTDEQGRFTFDEVQDGSYTLTISPPRPNPRPYMSAQPAVQANVDPNQKFAARHLEISVGETDLTNLSIEVSSGGRISGVLTIDGGKPLPRSLLVYLELATGERIEQPPATLQPDGTFTLEGISAGSYFLRVGVQSNAKYYTKSVMQGRSDLTREPLAIKEGEEINNVRMVISTDVAQLSGRVLASDGKSPESGVSVLFISADPVEQKTMSRRMYGFTNADGIFRVSGAPGEYLAIIMRPGENFYQMRGDALKLRAATAQRVTLQPGENTKIELVVPDNK